MRRSSSSFAGGPVCAVVLMMMSVKGLQAEKHVVEKGKQVVDCEHVMGANRECVEAAKYLVEYHTYSPSTAFMRLTHEKGRGSRDSIIMLISGCPVELGASCASLLDLPIDVLCDRALSQITSGAERASCGARIHFTLEESANKAEQGQREAVRSVVGDYPECGPVLELGGCGDSAAVRGMDFCNATKKNDFRTRMPAVLVSLARSGSKELRPLLSCTGVATEVNHCGEEATMSLLSIAETKTREDCLNEGGYHILDGTVGALQGATIESLVSRIDWLNSVSRDAAAMFHSRQPNVVNEFDPRTRVIVLTRSPLNVVFSWLEATFHKGSLQVLEDKEFFTIPSQRWRELRVRASQTSRLNRALAEKFSEILFDAVQQEAQQFVHEASGMYHFLENNKYNTISVKLEDLRDHSLRTRVVAAVLSHALGDDPNFKPTARQVIKAFTASETVYSDKPPATEAEYATAEDLWRAGPQILCALLAVEGFGKGGAELGYGATLHLASQEFCEGGDEKSAFLLDVPQRFRDAIHRHSHAGCKAHGLIRGLDPEWRRAILLPDDPPDSLLPDGQCKGHNLDSFFAPTHEMCCDACAARRCVGLSFVLASPLEQAGMCHLALDSSPRVLAQLHTCHDTSRASARIVLSSRRQPASYTSILRRRLHTNQTTTTNSDFTDHNSASSPKKKKRKLRGGPAAPPSRLGGETTPPLHDNYTGEQPFYLPRQ